MTKPNGISLPPGTFEKLILDKLSAPNETSPTTQNYVIPVLFVQVGLYIFHETIPGGEAEIWCHQLSLTCNGKRLRNE